MYAILRTGSKQYRAEKGATLEIDRQSADEGGKIEFDQVVLLSDGDKVSVGAPVVKGAKVIGEVVRNFRGDKVRVYKYKRRRGYHRTRGHRSALTLVKITDIVAS